MPKQFLLTSQRFLYPAGTPVFSAQVHDYGLARDDTNATGVPHVSVTLDKDGGYPFFTVLAADLAASPA